MVGGYSRSRRALRRVGGDGHDLARTVAQRVHGMAPRHEQSAPARLRPGLPCRAGAGGVEPMDVLGLRQDEIPEGTIPGEPPRQVDHGVPTEHEADLRDDLRCLDGGHHVGERLLRQGDRLLHDQVSAGAGDRHRLRRMEVVRGCDHDDLHIVTVEDRGERVTHVALEACCLGATRGRGDRAAGQDPDGGMGIVGERLDVLMANGARAMDADAEDAGGHLVSHPGPSSGSTAPAAPWTSTYAGPGARATVSRVGTPNAWSLPAAPPSRSGAASRRRSPPLLRDGHAAR